ncbi:hypothetical protein RI129_003395 [Pyrocoelia pectoralis]|uniref:threonine--tRNA ligase n=1 Tax=Pyrocoelia pectoralis TaxID=417401 RepID=A0AAN7ZV06_9COLE
MQLSIKATLRTYNTHIWVVNMFQRHYSKTASKVKDMKNDKAFAKNNSIPFKKLPEFIQQRELLWNKLKENYNKELLSKPQHSIKVSLSDGKHIDAVSWKTTAFDIANHISPSLAENVIVAKVNGVLWDLNRPLEENCDVELLKFDNDEAKSVFWHSSAHILGEALERTFIGYLCYGPPIDPGFYYDMYLQDKTVSPTDFPQLEKVIKEIVNGKQSFERLVVRKDDLFEMFKYNPFKVRILNEKINSPTATVYRCGSLIDVCRGPHILHTGKVKAFKLTKNSSTYWEGNSDSETLQRIYGISFPDTKLLQEWEQFQEEAIKRDHRRIGKDQELFFFHDLSPGCCFFQPRGTHIYNTLIEFVKELYRERKYLEVVTPNMFNAKLWQQSGHWAHYAHNMFSFNVENDTFALKPMNCPGHCLIFQHRVRSWRELPFRCTEFGIVHRNELSGTLTGLTRVRRFQQDDGHVFCSVDQIQGEITESLDFLNRLYTTFGFSFNLVLSTRPEKFLGDIEIWNQAEKALENSLTLSGYSWSLNPEDGAFYGPKIDIIVLDALKRSHQCGTIQLDFQLPIRFNLSYKSSTGEQKRPVIIHRALLGSVERIFAILTEHYGGKWPFWLSPRQVMVIPISASVSNYASEVERKLYEAGFMVELDLDHGDTFNKKIRNAQQAQFNYILVVGEKEQANNSVNVRTRNNEIYGEISIDKLIDKFRYLKEKRVIGDSL